MYELFLEAVQQYHLPSRIRTDQGGENVMVAQHMLEKRGPERRSVIVGGVFCAQPAYWEAVARYA